MKQFNLKRWVVLLVIACSTAFSSGVFAEGIAQVTGVQWTTSSEAQKKAYLIGMANIAEIEMAYRGNHQITDDQSVLARMQRGLKGQTLDSVRVGLDKWYADNAGKLEQPVIQTIWDEMVVPSLNKGN